MLDLIRSLNHLQISRGPHISFCNASFQAQLQLISHIATQALIAGHYPTEPPLGFPNAGAEKRDMGAGGVGRFGWVGCKEGCERSRRSVCRSRHNQRLRGTGQEWRPPWKAHLLYHPQISSHLSLSPSSPSLLSSLPLLSQRFSPIDPMRALLILLALSAAAPLPIPADQDGIQLPPHDCSRPCGLYCLRVGEECCNPTTGESILAMLRSGFFCFPGYACGGNWRPDGLPPDRPNQCYRI